MNYQPVFQSYQVSDPVRPRDALFTTSSSHLSLWCNFSRLKLQIQPWLRLLEVLNVIYFGLTGFISRIEVFKNDDNCHRRCCISNWQLWHYTLERFVAHYDILHLSTPWPAWFVSTFVSCYNNMVEGFLHLKFCWI